MVAKPFISINRAMRSAYPCAYRPELITDNE